MEGDDLQVAMSQERQRRQDALEGIKNGNVRYGCLPEELRDDAEIALAAIHRKPYGDWRGTLSARLRSNRVFVLEAVKCVGLFLKHASEELRADREIVVTAVQQFGGALPYASRELRADREIVSNAVRQNVLALRYASEELRGDQEVVLAAIGNIRQQAERVDMRMPMRILRRSMSRHLQNDPVVAGAIIRKGGRLKRGSEIVERLENVLLAVRTLPEVLSVEDLVDEASVVEFYLRWEHWVWRKIWMALHLEPPGMQGTGRLFVELSGLPLELRQAKELRQCAPVIGAVLFSFPGFDWRDLDSFTEE